MPEGKNGLIVFAISLGLFVATINNSITSAAVTHIIEDLNDFERLNLIFTAYVLASTSTMLIFGKLSDQFGRKLIYLIGLGFFGLGSLLSGLAQSFDQLVAFRAVQGIGQGAVFPVSFSIIYSIYADPRKQARMAAVLSGIYGLAAFFGPLIGGLILEFAGWRWCFHLNVPIALVSFLIVLFAVRESRADTKPKVDYPGTIALIATVVSFMFALDGAGKGGQSMWQTVVLFAVAAAAAVFFILIELKASEPILPPGLYRKRTIVAITLGVFCQGAMMMPLLSYLPVFVTSVLGFGSSYAFLTVLLLSVTAGAAVFSFLHQRLSYTILILSSKLLGLLALLMIIAIGHEARGWYLAGLLIMLGFAGLGPLMSVAQNEMAANLEARALGTGSSLIGFWRNIGNVIGTTLTAAIVNAGYSRSIAGSDAYASASPESRAVMANPDALIGGETAGLAASAVDAMRESLAAAVDSGFLAVAAFAAIGAVSALAAGPVRNVRRTVRPPKAN